MTEAELLVQAIQMKDVPAARALLSSVALRARLNDAAPGVPFGATPLLIAHYERDTEMMQLLLDAGADINQRSHWWAGSFGVLDGGYDLVDWLVARGAKVDAHSAARLGRVDELRWIINEDPSRVHARGGDGQMPLHFASTIEIADLLLQHGADINALDVDHESTPAQWMIRDRTEVARHLVARGAKTDLFLVTALGDLDRVRAELDRNPQFINATINSNEWFPRRNPRASHPIYFWTLGSNKTPHRVARDFGHTDVLALLMERSPDDLRVAVACELEDEGMLDRVTNAGTLRFSPSAPQQVKLVWAAEHNNAREVHLLLTAGWPVDSHTASGITALHFACWHGNAEMVRELLRHGAPLDVREREHGGTPLDWAKHGVDNSWFCKTGDYPEVMQALGGA